MVARKTVRLFAACPCTATALTPCTARSLCTADCTCVASVLSCNVMKLPALLVRAPAVACSRHHMLWLDSTKHADKPAVECIQRHQHLVNKLTKANVLGNAMKNMQHSAKMHNSMLACHLPLKPRATADSRCFCSCDGFFTVYSIKYMLFLALASSSLASCKTHCRSAHL